MPALWAAYVRFDLSQTKPRGQLDVIDKSILQNRLVGFIVIGARAKAPRILRQGK